MFTGNGAYVVHESLSAHIPEYKLIPLSPRWQYFPVALPFLFSQKADILHTTPDYATFFRSKCRYLFLTFQNFVLDEQMQQYSSAKQRLHYRTDLKWFTRKAMSEASVITAVSKSTAKLVRSTLDYQGEIEIIYNGIDTNLFLPKTDYGNDKEFNILFSGNLSRRKGAHMLTAIAEKLTGNSVIYYTGGLNPRSCMPFHKKLRPLGPIAHKDMARLYQQMDVLLFPSFREGFSLAVLEAMASALPVITSNCSSMPEQITEGKGGFLCRPGDIDQFAEKLNLLSGSTELCRNMGQFNRTKVEAEFSLQTMVNRYKSAFERMSA